MPGLIELTVFHKLCESIFNLARFDPLDLRLLNDVTTVRVPIL